jgi:hypothetical protein
MPKRQHTVVRTFVFCCILAVAISETTFAQSNEGDDLSDAYTRLTTGLEIAGGKPGDQKTTYLVDFLLTAPLTPERDKRRSPLLGTWLNARLTSVPQQSVTKVKQFVGGFQPELLEASSKDLVNGLTFLAGVEFPLGRGVDFDSDKYRLSPMLVVAAGFITPGNASEQIPIFKLTPEARSTFNVPADTAEKKYGHIAFVSPERDNFYTQWYVGLRLRTNHYPKAGVDKQSRFPGIIDITVGQNSAVNGGTLGKGLKVWRIDAFYPLPKQGIYLFGAAFLHRKQRAERTPLILQAADAAVAVTGSDVFVHTLTPEERVRDLWKFGIGVDLIALFSRDSQGAQPKK